MDWGHCFPRPNWLHRRWPRCNGCSTRSVRVPLRLGLPTSLGRWTFCRSNSRKPFIPVQRSFQSDSVRATWSRVRPVVAQIIVVLRALAIEIPTFGKVVEALQTLSQLIDSLCGVSATAATPAEAAGDPQILIWEDDPYLTAVGTDAPEPAQPISASVPNNTQPLLKTHVAGPQPPPGKYSTTTPEFRFWNAQAALARGINYWGPILPSGTQWSSDTVPLSVGLDQGSDFNAFYARENGLNFFHGVVNRVHPPVTAYSGESPHVVCHELGHAILDAVKPELFDAMSAEVAAFHESFGDMSSILSALQVDTIP